MKKFSEFLFSTTFTIILLSILSLALAIATFIEEFYDTTTAMFYVYNAAWFEFLLVLLVINFLGQIQKYKLLNLQKIPGFIFHAGFVIMIIGAAISRYFGYEGIMHIREGNSSNTIYSFEPYLLVKTKINDEVYTLEQQSFRGNFKNNKFHKRLNIKDDNINFKYYDYFQNADEVIKENISGGTDIIELIIMTSNGREKVTLNPGETYETEHTKLSFQNPSANEDLSIFIKDNKLFLKSQYSLAKNNMGSMEETIIPADSAIEFEPMFFYTSLLDSSRNNNNITLIFRKLYKNAKKQIIETNDINRTDAFLLEVSYKNEKKIVTLWGGPNVNADFQNVKFKDLYLEMAYGQKPIVLPFSIHLIDFNLTRYPGSMSPSSYESYITLIDTNKNIKKDDKIYMNNVLNYGGYRFFQSSYDKDEKGTILSVNHDYMGTLITYIGYALLGIGFLLTLLNKNSRFSFLSRQINEIRKNRKNILSLLLPFLLLFPLSTFTQEKPVSKEHASNFGHLLVQTYDGRFAPMHTLAYDVMHKISRKDKFETPHKGKMDGMQVFLDMFMDPEYWKNQDIIYIREKSVKDLLGINKSKASYNDFFHGNNYRLAEFAENAFRKKASEQTSFDKEILKTDERVNICHELFNGNLFRIFPVPNSPNHKWTGFMDSLSFIPLTGPVTVINEDLQLKEFNYFNILRLYFSELSLSIKSGNYEIPDKILSYVSNIQTQLSKPAILPSDSKINYEIFYNKSHIFENLRNLYGILSIILLFLAFSDNFKKKKNKILTYALNFFTVILGLGFLYHTFGLGLRWYLTEHAPWSNGYEALLLVGWGSLLAGFIFLKYSRITLAATAILAFSMLMTAGHSSYDPQLTNLQPVLKSYWLIIHVAVITISYGFLGLGFFLGIINLILYVIKNQYNKDKTVLLIKELSYINEMNLIIGLFLATMGTFLGGVWANESWGRYWGWDAKETWALIIIVVYSIILHLRLVPQLSRLVIFNIGSVIAFATVLMTFIGVNYYLSKGLHSYASGDTPVFPVWAWIIILLLFALFIIAYIKDTKESKTYQ